MIKVNTTQIQEHLAKFLGDITQGAVVIEQAGKAIATLISYEEWERLKQLESDLMAENDEDFFSPEEVIEAYNCLHGTNFTRESIIND